MAGVIFDAAGNLYGTTSYGRRFKRRDLPRWVWRGVQAGAQRGRDLTRRLQSSTGLGDGGKPDAGLVFDTVWHPDGTTAYGGIFLRPCVGPRLWRGV